MKYFITSTLLLLAMLMPATANADKFEADGIYYTTSENIAVVTYQDDPQGIGNSYSGNVVIPETVTNDLTGETFTVISIGSLAFYGCHNLTGISLPNTIESIQSMAFYACIGLTRIDIPNSVRAIGDNAFYDCKGLTGLTLPNSVNEIGEFAFAKCDNLTNVTIPSSVISISYGAFIYCPNLTDVYCFISDPSTVDTDMFVFHLQENDYTGRTLHVPFGSSNAYQNNSRWQPYFEFIVEMRSDLVGDVDGDGVLTIADVVDIIDYLLHHDATALILDNADVNGDNIITIADATALIDYILTH